MSDRMKRMEEPASDLGEMLAQAGRELGKALGNLGFVASAQGAMGWMVQGEPEKAREALDGLDEDQRAKVAEAARQLAEMAQEGTV